VGEKSSPEFIDIDNDEDYDLFVGCEDGTIWFYENIGNPDSCDFEYVTDNYFDIYTGEVSVPRFCDIDNDGDFDLFVANESAGNTLGFEGDIAFYENTGDEYNADFTFVTGNYLFMDMSLATSANIADIDDDGLFEIMVGILGGKIVLLENRGTQSNPEYIFADSSFLNLSLTYQPRLDFEDIDYDGDLDMAVSRGSFTSYVELYRNTGSAEEPIFDFYQTIITSTLDYSLAGVDFCDIDGDNDYDIFAGESRNRIQYWENIGDQYNPRYELSAENYLNQPLMIGFLFPRFNDIDHDGDYDLIMGTDYGSNSDTPILYWRNDGNQQVADFILHDTLYTSPAGESGSFRIDLADIDNDGDDDMFVGEGGGAMLFFRNLEYNSVNGRKSTVDRSFALYPNYPNPFNASTTIPFTLDQKLPVKIVIYNQLGQNIVTLFDGMMDSGIHQVNWDADGVSSGVYLIRLDTQAGYSESRKVMLVK